MGINDGLDDLPSELTLKEQGSIRELLNTILDHLPLGVFVKDASNNFNYLYWNKFMEDITGINASLIEGHDDSDVNYDTLLSAEIRCEIDREVIDTGKTVEFHGKVQTPAGEIKDIEVTKFPISLSNGKTLLLAFWRDITAKNAIENAFKRTQTLTKLALQSSDIHTCSIFVNPDSTDEYADTRILLNGNEGHRDIQEAISWPEYISNVHPEDQENYWDLLRKMCSGKMSEVKFEVRVKYNGNTDYHWREASAYVYERDEKGRPSVILGCSINIQDRKGQALSLEEARAKAEVADKMKSKYLADMSHEIRTPLNAITGFSEMMAFADTDEERMSYYEIIKANNLLLMQLINDILDLSKIEADAIKISYVPVDLNEMMDITYASVKPRMPKGVALKLEKGLDKCTFGTDQIRLLQLINNLINNAIKNTKEGSITMGYKALEDGRLKFYVKDTGMGIAEDKLQSLFNRFVKINDYVEGIGLGLAICNGLVTKMGGSIHVESKLGEGSTFSFILPSHD